MHPRLYIHYEFIFRYDYLMYSEWNEALHRRISDIVSRFGGVLYLIKNRDNRVHFLIGISSARAASNLMNQVMSGLSLLNHERKLKAGMFSKEDDLCIEQPQEPDIITSVEMLEMRRRKRDFIEEYQDVLRLFNIEDIICVRGNS